MIWTGGRNWRRPQKVALASTLSAQPPPRRQKYGLDPGLEAKILALASSVRP